jgi:hypothetical protein
MSAYSSPVSCTSRRPGPARPGGTIALAAAAVAVAALGAGCGSEAPASHAASPAPANSFDLFSACNYMRNAFDTSNTAEDKQVAAWLAGTKAGTDFSRLINNGGSAGAAAAGKAMAADCAAAGVTITFTADTPAPSPSASSQPAPAPTMTGQTDLIVFKVSGTGYPSIQYGPTATATTLRAATARWATVLPCRGRRL